MLLPLLDSRPAGYRGSLTWAGWGTAGRAPTSPPFRPPGLCSRCSRYLQTAPGQPRPPDSAALGSRQPCSAAADEPAPSSPAKPLLVINASHRPKARDPGIYGRPTSTLNKLVVFTNTHYVKAQILKKKKILVPSLISNKAVAGNSMSRLGNLAKYVRPISRG